MSVLAATGRMSAPSCDRIVVVSGLGNAQGTGAACARLFNHQLGYKVALISRPRKEVDDLKAEINQAGGTVSCPASTGLTQLCRLGLQCGAIAGKPAIAAGCMLISGAAHPGCRVQRASIRLRAHHKGIQTG